MIDILSRIIAIIIVGLVALAVGTIWMVRGTAQGDPDSCCVASTLLVMSLGVAFLAIPS
jgi:hypothetical protein